MQEAPPAALCPASLALMVAGLLGPSLAVSAPYCPGHTDRASVPTALEPKVAAAFGIPTEAARLAVVRCDGATLLACSIGANLNCGKADVRRSLPGASAYCRENPASDFIPMFATGHATIYEWRCAGGRAVAGTPVLTVDPRGYVAENWKAIR
jgi:hypothetical protein